MSSDRLIRESRKYRRAHGNKERSFIWKNYRKQICKLTTMNNSKVSRKEMEGSTMHRSWLMEDCVSFQENNTNSNATKRTQY